MLVRWEFGHFAFDDAAATCGLVYVAQHLDGCSDILLCSEPFPA